MRKQITIGVLGVLLLGLGAKVAADIPFFWLDKPTGRSNPNDPKSPLYLSPTPLPIAPPPGGTATFTPTATLTASPTATPTPPPPGSTATFTPTATLTASPTASPTVTPTPGGHGSNVTNGESGLQTDWVGNPGSVYESIDTYGTTFNPNPFATTAGGSDLPGGTAGNAFCMNGDIVAEAPPNYPYAVIVMELVAAGATLGGPGVDVGPYAPDNSLSFSFRATSAGVQYMVDLVTTDVGDYAYYRYTFTPPNTNWNRYTVYFPDGSGTPQFAQPGWATPRTWLAPDHQKQKVGAIRFQPVATGSPQAYNFCVDDVTFAAPPPPTATATRTATPFFSPTMTPTPMAGFSGLWYDGDTPGAQAADVSFDGDAGTATVGEVGSGGYSGAYFRAQFSVPAAGYYSSADIARPGTTDVSAFNQLEFRMRVPSSGGGCFTGGVQLVTDGTAPDDRSRPVTVTAYVNGGIDVDTWVHVRIPLTAFNGNNHESPPYSFSASDLANITAVRFRPYYNDFEQDGSFDGEVHIDNLAFSVGAPAPAERLFGPMFANFETNTQTNWGGYWSSYNDQDAPDFTCSPATPTSRTFPSSPTTAPIVSDGTGASGSPCSYGKISGYLGGDGTGSGGGTCGAGNWSYAGMGANFDPAGGTASVDVPAALGFTPSALRFRIRAGSDAPAAPGQSYIVTLTLNAPQNTCGGCEWQLLVTPTSTWQTITAPFPADGTVGTSSPISSTNWGQPTWAGTPLTWNSTTWTLFRQLAIAPANRNSDFNVEWDDIEFVP